MIFSDSFFHSHQVYTIIYLSIIYLLFTYYLLSIYLVFTRTHLDAIGANQ